MYKHLRTQMYIKDKHKKHLQSSSDNQKTGLDKTKTLNGFMKIYKNLRNNYHSLVLNKISEE